jgi:predicted GTPase
LLVEFYDGQGSSAKSREYIRIGELQNCVSNRLKEGVENTTEEDEEQKGIAYRNMLEAYEALCSDDKGSRAKTTKEGFLHNIFIFLEKQGLIEYVEEDEMIKTTKKLDNIMDWNILNQNNYQRVRKVLRNE